jgi:hypothetical protein
VTARPKLGVLILLALLAAVATACRPPVFFPEIVVNTSEPGENNPNDAAIGPDGDFLVAWWEGVADADVLVRHFDADTSPLSGAFPVNVNTPPASDSSIARDAEGRFVVVWEEGSPLDHIRGRRFASDGTPLGDDFQISTSTLNSYDPFVASDPSGNFVVTWTSGGDGVARRFDSEGVALGGEIPVNAFTTGTQRMSGIAMSATGFVVTWLGPGSGGDDGIFGRRFDPDGVPTAGFQVNTDTLSLYHTRPDVAMSADGDFVVVWSDGNPTYTAFGRRYDSAGAPLGDVFQVSANTTRNVLYPKVVSDTTGNFLVTWSSFPAPHNGRIDVHARFFNFDGSSASGELQVNEFTTALHMYPWPALADDGSFVVAFRNQNEDVLKARKSGARASHEIVMDAVPKLASSPAAAPGNGVFEPGETQVVHTAWVNDTAGDEDDVVATTELFTGPPGADYTINHDVAGYGLLLAGQATSCLEPDCFSVTVSEPAIRPEQHWDALLQEETNMGIPHTWVLHLGESFPDVPTDNLFYKFVETLFHKGVTGGCAGGGYCPANPVTRAQMAVFLLKSKFGSAHIPPPCAGSVFPDVPCTGGPFDPWIEELAGLGITGGCGGGNYCPNNTVTRQQMAVFLLKAFEGSSYDPPDCTGIFDDVTCTPGTGFSDWIEELYNRSITGGCSVTPLNYCPTNPNNRGQMAVFLVKTFGLVLYGG